MLSLIRKFLFILFIIPVIVLNQLKINIPDSFNIYLNDSKFYPNKGWMDSLLKEAGKSNIKYKIVKWYTYDKRSITTLQIPQTLSIGAILRQVLLYFYLKTSEQEKENDKVLIYPFGDIDYKAEYIRCRYFSKDLFKFIVKKWDTIPPPAEPTPEEKYLYDKIMKYSLNETQFWGKISKQVYHKIASENNIPLDSIKVIFQKVVLWKISQSE